MVLVVAVQAGCATPQKQIPVTIKEATPGTAVIYFFRPVQDQVDAWSSPMLAIDERSVATLDHGTYTSVALAPGVHKVSLAAGPSNSANWNQSAEFKVDSGITYYVALWHQNQLTPTPSYITFMYGAIGYLVFQAMHPPQGSAAARLEPVERDIAEYGLSGLRYIAPMNESMTVH
jgi:hypothetical protein